MLVLADTGVLLRCVGRSMPLHVEARAAVRQLRAAGHSLVAFPQNVAEFWNVCTRPNSARGGLGLSVAQAAFALRLVERIAIVLPESPLAYQNWKRLVLKYGVQGAQVHDARLVSQMISIGITHLTTFNVGDFKRYAEITVFDAMSVVSP